MKRHSREPEKPIRKIVKKAPRIIDHSANQKARSPEEAALMVAHGEVLKHGGPEQRRNAENLLRNGKRGLGLDGKPVIVTGGELVVEGQSGINYLLDTMGDPNQITARASRERINLLSGDNTALALDAAESIRGANSLEKMLAHQMAAAHALAMGLISQIEANENADDIVKLVNASTRLMSTFQNGMTTLARVRTGGKQEVVVQHVHVNGDSQAVIAGKMDYPGGRGPGRGE